MAITDRRIYGLTHASDSSDPAGLDQLYQGWTHGSYNRLSEKQRRVRPEFPYLNPTFLSGTKLNLAIGTSDLRHQLYWWGQPKGWFKERGPAFGVNGSNPSASMLCPKWLNDSGDFRSQTDYLAELQNAALLQLSDRKLDVATMLMEARTTVEWLGARTKTLAEGLHAIRRGKIKDFVKAVNNTPAGVRPRWVKDLKRYKPPRNPKPPPTTKSPFGGDASSRWLEYNYALMPLVYDVVGAAQVLAEYFNGVPISEMWPVRVKLKKLEDISSEMRGSTSLSWRIVTDLEGLAEWRGTIELWYTVDHSWLKSASSLGLIGPGVVWELVPYSFMVDKVIPIGDFIEACTATLGCTFVSGWQLERYKGFLDSTGMRSTESGYVVDKEGSANITFTGFQRTPLTQFPSPRLYLKNPLSLRNAVTTVALIRQLI